MIDTVKRRILELEEKKHFLLKDKDRCNNILKYRAILDSIKKTNEAIEFNNELLAKPTKGKSA